MWRIVRTLILCAWAAPCLAIDPAPKSKDAAEGPVARIANHWEIGPIAGAEQFPVALSGYCVVQLHDQRQWVPGRGGEATRFDGLEYRFDSARDRHIFLSAREQYVPMLGGDCPVTYVETGNRIAGKLEHGTLHRRRLVFFAGPNEQQAFAASPEKYENADLVLSGNSVVSMIDAQKCVPGIPASVAIHRGLRYYFANDFERRIFLKNPARYDGSGQNEERPNLLMESRTVTERVTVKAFQLNSAKSRQGFGGAKAAKDAALGALPAMSGYCPVSLREDGTWVRGRQEFSVVFKNITFLTAGARERDLLKSDPTEYLPACSGECAVSLVERKEHVRGSVFHAAEFDGRLFLFADASAKARFKADPAKYALVDVATNGYCAVTLVDKEEQVPGVQQFAAWYDGKVYRFAGAAEKAKFLADPKRYAEDAE
jgi:YHS domain-containing protein